MVPPSPELSDSDSPSQLAPDKYQATVDVQNVLFDIQTKMSELTECQNTATADVQCSVQHQIKYLILWSVRLQLMF